MRYFLQLRTKPDRFDEVDDFVFANRRNVCDGEFRRYTDSYITIDGGDITFNGTFPIGVIGHLPRMCGITLDITKSNPKGFFNEPESVVIRHGKRETLYNLKTKTRWKRAA